MSKLLIESNLRERTTKRALLAVSLCAIMAALGCTTDRNLGNGDPVVTPGLRSAPTAGAPSGSESEPLPPPMMSSYSSSAPQPSYSSSPQPRLARLSADEAAAIIAQQQRRVRVLGTISPNIGGRPYESDRLLPQQRTEVRSSVNSTIYSQPTEAITSGAGEPVGSVDATANAFDTNGVTLTSGGNTAPAISGSTVPTGTTASTTPVTNAGAPVISPLGAGITPTSNALSAPGGFASVRTLSPTASSVLNPPASISGVRVINSNGRVTITNTGSTRQQ
ncbi:MAG: hypothetical protein M3P06_17730 [Acidobacteriota bacterium]|nr:hypothetical protein [Acidobacteriota bacterium]